VSPEDARGGWTDERLDDLVQRIDTRFAELSARIDLLSKRIDRQGEMLAARIDRQGELLNARIDSLQRTMIQVGGGMIASILIGSAGIVATQI
jgi:hypothetical protein